MADHEADMQDQRANARSSLMLRSAKLVCQSGEYVCIVRDVSAEGVGLRFMHAVPTEPRVILELSNGATYPIERVWKGKQQAGYRFARAIELQDFIHEPSPFESRPIRLRIRAQGVVEAHRVAHRIRLLDLSRGGALIECGERFGQGAYLTLELPGMDVRPADVCWRKGGQHGLMFHDPLTTQQLASIAMQLQPFTANIPATFGRRASAPRAA
ncbi:PilZ domain-containing protein [Parerythrobacter aestuarii]|uniref:PilZ domain-containing protein n=1 Tax=Parerythrobacter aestuarii TaxID=3020909 RepID=UPI0024DEF1C1|nr:PilZ domain-containing protein [Parerythrobacter aestuarii]